MIDHKVKNPWEIYPPASKNVLGDARTYCCSCGCRVCVLMGKLYYVEPISEIQLKQKLDEVIQMLS